MHLALITEIIIRKRPSMFAQVVILVDDEFTAQQVISVQCSALYIPVRPESSLAFHIGLKYNSWMCVTSKHKRTNLVQHG